MGASLLVLLPAATPVTDVLPVLMAAVLVGAGIWYLGDRLDARFGPENAEVIQALLLLAVATLTTVFVAVNWDGTGEVVTAVSLLEFGVDTVVRVLITVILLVAAYTLTRVLKLLLLRNRGGRTQFTSVHQRLAVFYSAQVVVFVGFALTTVVFWGVNLSELLVGAGVLGIILGFAAQETIGSMVAGFILILSRPFDVGDWVQIGEHEGFVSDITINNVRLRNLDGEHVVLPNRTVQNQTIVNRSREEKLRVRLEVGVDYSVQPGHAEAVALAALESLEEIMSQPSPEVVAVRFDDSAVILRLWFWIEDPIPQRRWQARRVAIHAVKEAFGREGVKIPFPQRELSGRAETGGFHVTDGERGSEHEWDESPRSASGRP
ncbi:mechanosensitive ion channel family protein [Haloarchaeobius sp. DYHT-AS-18]|uniref:mechanosensitive ion channel family protein n=1 Tax=Haloarchaeobius sp. DYHT-AS-18 TaxID=3446117 RepID=UPI003EBB895F